MRDWYGEGELMTDDDFEILAPTVYGSAAEVEDVSVPEAPDYPGDPVDVEPTDDPDVDLALLGTPDTTRSVRVWVSEGCVTRADVSPNWRTRRRDGNLGAAFTEALALAGLELSEPGPVKEPVIPDYDFDSVPGFSLANFAVLVEAVDEANAVDIPASTPESLAGRQPPAKPTGAVSRCSGLH